MSGHGQLQIHQRLDVRPVEVKDTFTEIKQAEGGDDPDDALHRGDSKHHVHIPCLGLILVMNVIIGNGQDGAAVEQCQHHNHHRHQRIKVEGRSGSIVLSLYRH